MIYLICITPFVNLVRKQSCSNLFVPPLEIACVSYHLPILFQKITCMFLIQTLSTYNRVFLFSYYFCWVYVTQHFFLNLSCSSDPVLREMWPDGKMSITEVTKRPLTAATLFKNSIIALVDKLACKVRNNSHNSGHKELTLHKTSSDAVHTGCEAHNSAYLHSDRLTFLWFTMVSL